MDQSSKQSDNGANSGGESGRAPAPPVVPEPKAKISDVSVGDPNQVLGKGPAPPTVREPASDGREKTGRNGNKAPEKLMKEIENMEQFKKLIEGPVSFLEFYDGLSRIFEKLGTKRGGLHITLPEKEAIKEEFEKCGGDKGYLDKQEFRQFLKNILSRGIGLRNYEMAMYLAGVPAISVIIKPFIPGTISEIPNSFFIPVVTSATAFILANMRKI